MILAGASVAFVAGVVLGSAFGAPGWIALALAALLAVAAWFRRRRSGWIALLVAAALCLGFWRSPHMSPATPADLRYYNGAVVQVTGTVSAEPDIRDTGANYEIAVDTMVAASRSRDVSGGLYVHTSSAVQLEYGDRVSLTGRLATTGSGGFSATLAHQGIFSAMRYPKLADLGPSPSQNWLVGQLLRLRQHLEAGIDAWLPEPEASLLIAITLGARSSQLGNLAPILVTTGLIHLIAISGIKVSLVAGMIQQAIRSFAGRLLSFLGAVATLWLYVLLTGFTASGVRSAGMWTLVFIASALGRGTVALLSLAVVLGIMIGFDPSLPWDTGFQMSAVGTLAIVAFASPWSRLVPTLRLPIWILSRREANSPPEIYLLPSPFREALTVTLAAQVGTLPIVIFGFHVVSGTGPLANAIVLPFLPLMIVLGFVLGVVAGIGSLAGPVSALAYVLVHATVRVATELAVLGAPSLGGLSPIAVVAYYAVLVCLGMFWLRRAQWAPSMQFAGAARELGVAAAIGLSLLTVSLASARSAPATRLTWLGTGNAMLLQSGGMNALIDGSNHPFTLLERLGAMLPYDGRAIDLIVVTDPRSSNVSGLQSVLAHYQVGEVLDTGVEYPTNTYARWRAALRARGVPVYALRTGVSITLGDTRITAIGPDALYPRAQDSAGLLRLTLPHRTVVLAAAADAREEHEAVFRGVRLRADTVVTGAAKDPALLHAVGGTSGVRPLQLQAAVTSIYP